MLTCWQFKHQLWNGLISHTFPLGKHQLCLSLVRQHHFEAQSTYESYFSNWHRISTLIWQNLIKPNYIRSRKETCTFYYLSAKFCLFYYSDVLSKALNNPTQVLNKHFWMQRAWHICSKQITCSLSRKCWLSLYRKMWEHFAILSRQGQNF